MASWLNTYFSGLDGAVFTAMNNINCGFLNFFCKYYSYIGEKGICLILAGLIMCCFSKTRKIGVCTVFAIMVGALFTNILLKNIVARPRPYTNAEYNAFWLKAGGVEEGEFSFPSGHATASMAFAVAYFASCNKKYSWIELLLALVMGFCRVYLVVHYTTDVVAGFLCGGTAGVISYFAVNAIYKYYIEKKQNKLNSFILNWNISELFTKNKKRETDKNEEE